MPAPPRWAARSVHTAGNTTRKLIGLPSAVTGASAPSIEQYAGADSVAAVHTGAASDTPDTGSPIDAVGIDVPSFSAEQSACAIVRTRPMSAVCATLCA